MMCGMMRRRPDRGTRSEASAGPVCSIAMVGDESGEGLAMSSYSLPVLPMVFGLAFAIMLLSMIASGPAAGWLLAIPVVPVLAAAILALRRTRGRSRLAGVSTSQEESLRGRYAKGEITRQRYQDGLVEIFKDRYARGIIDLDEYERRIARVFSRTSQGDQS